jgi:hypothetical protein
MIPRAFHVARTALALSAAAALTACGEVPALVQGPAICREAFSVQTATTADSLLVVLDAPSLTAEQQRRLELARAAPTAGREVVARLAASPERLLQPGHQSVLGVTQFRGFVVVGQQLESSAGHLSWYGRLVGDNGEATLVLTSEGITGGLLSIPANGSMTTSYAFHPLGGGLHAVTCLDTSKFGPD